MQHNNQIQHIQNEEFGALDVIMIDDKPYFPATECAIVLGYKNPYKAISDHCKRDGVTKREGVSSTTNQHGVITKQTVEKSYITEGNLYRLIIRSQLPSAERFEKWVFDEVLPQIRKTGMYIPNSLIVSSDLIPRLKDLCEKFNIDPAKRTEEMIRDFLLEVYIKSDMKKEKRKVKARRDETTCRIILPDELAYRLGEIAKLKEVSPDEIVEDVITDWLNGDGYEIWKKDWVR